MLRAFDGTFWLGTLLVVLALAIVTATLRSVEIPILGSGRLALLAVGGLGLAACISVRSGTTVVDGKTVFDVTAPVTFLGMTFGLASVRDHRRRADRIRAGVPSACPARPDGGRDR